jgi:prenyltransferase beta subunit
MKKRVLILLTIICGLLLVIVFSYDQMIPHSRAASAELKSDSGCVFNTIMGAVDIDSIIDVRIAENKLPPDFYKEIPAEASKSIDLGLDFLMQAQQHNGGWGAGLHSMQNITDPHAVKTDPATTSVVALAIVHAGSSLDEGAYQLELNKAHQYLLQAVEESADNDHNITNLTGTQIQSKLGQSIDAILTAQYLTRSLDLIVDDKLEERTRVCLQACVQKIQQTQDTDGSFKGQGWAGLLHSSYANNALELAKSKGIDVNEEILDQSRQFQKDNYNYDSGSGSTEKGAGVMLYSISSSSRASATESKQARKVIKKAVEDGDLAEDAEITRENLMEIGYSESEATTLEVADKVYQSSKIVAQQDEIMSGFGNNGGEEFLSFLQTGEGMIVNEDVEWKSWYDKVSSRMISIQENNGSWQGRHCITSPVFCTATAILILSVNNEIDQLAQVQ